MIYGWNSAPSVVHGCPTANTTNAKVTDNNKLYFYGATSNDEHLPFHTDFMEAMTKFKNSPVNIINQFTIGCMPY